MTTTHPGNADAQTVSMPTPVEVGNFAVVQDDFMKEHGINKGDTIYVAGNLTVPVDGKDPYALRMLFVAARCDEDGHVLPNEGAFTVDGKRLVPVSPDLQEQLDDQKNEDFDYVKES